MTTINGNSAGMPQIKAAVPKWEDGCPVVFSNDVPVHIHKPDENAKKPQSLEEKIKQMEDAEIKAAVPKWEDGCPVVFSNDVPVHIHKPDENTQKDDISIYDEINKKEKEIAEMQKYLEEIMPKNIEAEKEIEEKMHSIGKPTED